MGQPSANRTTSNPWPWVFVLLVVLFSGYVRIRLLDMPLERDEGEYAYSGQLMLQGIAPYQLAANMKLPGTYFIAAVGMFFFGQTIQGLHWTLIVANSLTIIFVFLLGRKLFGSVAGVMACATYAVMALSPMVLGLMAHANHFVVLFAVPGVLLLLKAGESQRLSTWFGSGLLFGLGFLMKQQGIVFCAFGWLVLIWDAWHNQKLLSVRLFRTAVVFGLGMALPFALTVIILAACGVFPRFWFWTFTYAHIYATVTPLSEGWGMLRSHLRQTRDISFGLWFFAGTGLLLAWSEKSARRATTFTGLFWLFSFLGTAIGLYFRPHYFILLLPATALLVGLGAVQWQRLLHVPKLTNVFQTLPLIFLALALCWVVYYHAFFYFQWPADRVSAGIYPSEPFVEAVAVGNYLRDHSAPDAKVALLGSEPEIFFYGRRHSVSEFIYTDLLMKPEPVASSMQRDMMREIESNRPDYFVTVNYPYSWALQDGSDHTILDWAKGYAATNCELVGFVHRNAAGAVESVWDDSAKQRFDPNNLSIAVYRRSPSPRAKAE